MTLSRAVLVISVLISFTTPFVASSVTIALPAIARHFGMSALLLNWINNAYLLASAFCLLPFGRLADIVGRRRVMVVGVVSFILASTAIVLSPSAFWLILFRVLQGMAAALVFSTSVALLTSVIDPAERGRMLGINTASVYAGLSCGPVIGGWVIRFLGWKALFLFPLPLCAAALYLLFRHVRGEWAESREERYDTPGAILYAVSLVALMTGITFISLWKWLGAGAVAFGLAGLAAFIRRQAHVAFPLLRVEMFGRNRVFAFSNLAALINYSATFALSILISLYLQSIRGFPPQRAGLVMLAQPLLQAVCSPFFGRLSDRVDPRLIASLGMALCMACLAVFIFLTPQTPILLLVGNLSLMGVGFAAFSSPNTNAVLGAVERRDYGLASSILATMRMLGQMLSSGLFTLMIAIYLGRAKIDWVHAIPFMRSIHATFILFTLLCGLGIFFSLARGNSLDRSRGG